MQNSDNSLPIDTLSPAVLNALFNKPYDRDFIINIEATIINFIKDENSYELKLDPMNSYYRLLSHQIAQYHNLKHILKKVSTDLLFLILLKDSCNDCTVTLPLLKDIPSQSNAQNNNNNKAKKIKLLKRANSNIDNSNEIETHAPVPIDITKDITDTNTTVTSSSVSNNDSYEDLEAKRLEKEKNYEKLKQQIYLENNNNSSNPNLITHIDSPQPLDFETSKYKNQLIDDDSEIENNYYQIMNNNNNNSTNSNNRRISNSYKKNNINNYYRNQNYNNNNNNNRNYKNSYKYQYYPQSNYNLLSNSQIPPNAYLQYANAPFQPQPTMIAASAGPQIFYTPSQPGNVPTQTMIDNSANMYQTMPHPPPQYYNYQFQYPTYVYPYTSGPAHIPPSMQPPMNVLNTNSNMVMNNNNNTSTSNGPIPKHKKHNMNKNIVTEDSDNLRN